jgi:MerR HTH family regulatory protein
MLISADSVDPKAANAFSQRSAMVVVAGGRRIVRLHDDDLAVDIGLSKSSAQRRLQIGRSIPADLRDDIRDLPIANSTTELLALAGARQHRSQIDLARLMVSQAKERLLYAGGCTNPGCGAGPRRLGVSTTTIRRHEREGLVTPAPRNRAGHRVYTSDELEALHAALFPQAEPK